jgi:UDP-3-O-[3-hydroxymyristoyl] N-acetylglucosamine deacetylase
LATQPQHTLKAAVQFSGVGVHTGKTVSVTLSPAAAHSGVAFVRTDVGDRDPRISARTDTVCETRLGTVIGNAAGVTVSTVEHLMATFCGLGVDNALVTLNGPEAPIMDGSAEPFVRMLDRVGLRPQAAGREYIEILEPIVVTDGDKRAALLPADAFEIDLEIVFDTAAIGRQRLELTVDETVFRRDLADSRTFGFLHEVEALRAAGLARGGSMDNVVVIDGGSVLNPQGLRRPDEFVRHKAMDAIGDLYLLGAPLIGRYEALCPGHALNNALARAVLERPSAWRLTKRGQSLARAV